MRIIQIAFAVSAALICAAQSPPPADNPILTHFRAYRAALEAGDLAVAETEGAAALDASIARDGDGGRTGVLALNLASVRLSRNDGARAYEPALRAYTISTARGAASGVDPFAARLTLGRAEIASGREDEGSARLAAALAAVPAGRSDLAANVYDAATAFGRASLLQRRYRDAILGWSRAGEFAHAAQVDPNFARGEARLWEGVAWFSMAASNENRDRGARPTDTRLGESRDRQDQYRLASNAINESVELMRPFAEIMGASPELTVAQTAYASALAWRGVLRARLESADREIPAQDGVERLQDNRPVDLTPACSLHVVAEPPPRFPREALYDWRIGSVVLRVLVNDTGQITDVRVAAAVPQEHFADAVMRVAPQWRLHSVADSAPNCRLAQIRFTVVNFMIGFR